MTKLGPKLRHWDKGINYRNKRKGFIIKRNKRKGFILKIDKNWNWKYFIYLSKSILLSFRKIVNIYIIKKSKVNKNYFQKDTILSRFLSLYAYPPPIIIFISFWLTFQGHPYQKIMYMYIHHIIFHLSIYPRHHSLPFHYIP